MKNFIFIILLIILTSCGGGGSESSSGGGGSTPNVIETQKNIDLEKNEDVLLNIPSEYTIIKSPDFGVIENGYFKSNGTIGSTLAVISFIKDGVENEITFIIKISEINLPPKINNTNFFIVKGNGIILNLNIEDEELSNLNYIIKRFPSVGNLYSYNDQLGYHIGYDSINDIYITDFELEIIDEKGFKDTKIITLNITGPNEEPSFLLSPYSYTIDEDNSLNFSYNFEDLDGDFIIHSISEEPLHGNLSGTYPNYTYTPNNNYFGTDSFTVKMDDGRGGQSESIVNININSVNDIPLSSNKVLNVFKDSEFNILNLEIEDPDDDKFSYTIINDFDNAIYYINDEGYMTYVPDENFVGQDILEFSIQDENGGLSSQYTIVVNVTEEVVTYPINLSNSIYEINKNEIKEFNLNFSGNIGNVSYEIVSDPVNGTLFLEGDDFIYVPSEDFLGNDNIEIRITDSENNQSNIGVISIVVKEKNYELFGFSSEGNFTQDEINNQNSLNINTLNSDKLYLDNLGSFLLNNTLDCNSINNENIDFINLIDNKLGSFSFIDNYSIDVLDSNCENNKNLLLNNGDSIISSSNNYYLMSKDTNVYFGINSSLLDSFTSLTSSNIIDSNIEILSFNDFSLKNRILNNTVLFGEDSSDNINKYFLNLPDSLIEYEDNSVLVQEKYYVNIYEDSNGNIKTKGVYLYDQNSDIYSPLTSIQEACDQTVVETIVDEYTKFDYLNTKTLSQMENDSTILFSDDADQFNSPESFPNGIDYIIIVPDLNTYSSLEDIEFAILVNKDDCINGKRTVDLTGDNGVLFYLDNNIILKLNSFYGESIYINENEEEEIIIRDLGSHLLKYEVN